MKSLETMAESLHDWNLEPALFDTVSTELRFAALSPDGRSVGIKIYNFNSFGFASNGGFNTLGIQDVQRWSLENQIWVISGNFEVSLFLQGDDIKWDFCETPDSLEIQQMDSLLPSSNLCILMNSLREVIPTAELTSWVFRSRHLFPWKKTSSYTLNELFSRAGLTWPYRLIERHRPQSDLPQSCRVQWLAGSLRGIAVLGKSLDVIVTSS